LLYRVGRVVSESLLNTLANRFVAFDDLHCWVLQVSDAQTSAILGVTLTLRRSTPLPLLLGLLLLLATLVALALNAAVVSLALLRPLVFALVDRRDM